MKKNLIRRRRRGAALVEYGLIVSGVALISAAAVAIFGHKTNDLIAAVASVLPGAHDDDNGPIVSGKLIETTPGGAGSTIALDITGASGITANSGTARLGNNLGVTNLDSLVVEAP